MEIKYKNRAAVINDLESGISLVSIIHYYLKKIEENAHLNAFVEVYSEDAILMAEKLQAKYEADPKSVGKLFGMIVSVKDVISHQHHMLTAASKIMQGYTALYSATAIEKLLAEDAIIIGRVNCDQFGMGSTNENSHYGAVCNADDNTKVPGGSSGGSAVSLQMDGCMVSLGSDTGGSVRQPAAFCGVYGFKPTYGRISRHGLIAYASSFDQIGIMANAVENISEVLHVISGADEFDSTCIAMPTPHFQIQKSNEKYKIAYFEEAIHIESIHPSIKNKTLAFIEHLKATGHEVVAVHSKYLDYLIPAYYVLTTAEASSNLSRYDGVRYGTRAQEVHSLDQLYRKSRTEGFSKEVKRRVLLGTFVLSSGYYDAYYTKAQKLRRLIAEEAAEIFKKHDILMMPTSPLLPWQIGTKNTNPVEMYLADLYTVHANMVGIPAINIPLQKSEIGENIGIQFMTNKFEENKLLSFVFGI